MEFKNLTHNPIKNILCSNYNSTEFNGNFQCNEMFPVNIFIAIFHCDKVVCHDHHAYTNTIKKT